MFCKYFANVKKKKIFTIKSTKFLRLSVWELWIINAMKTIYNRQMNKLQIQKFSLENALKTIELNNITKIFIN